MTLVGAAQGMGMHEKPAGMNSPKWHVNTFDVGTYSASHWSVQAPPEAMMSPSAQPVILPKWGALQDLGAQEKADGVKSPR
jgi:hypothetical protein